MLLFISMECIAMESVCAETGLFMHICLEHGNMNLYGVQPGTAEEAGFTVTRIFRHSCTGIQSCLIPGLYFH